MEENAVYRLRDYISERIIGQELLVDRLLMALLADGHLLVEGAPGLAKTRAIKVMGYVLEGSFQRIQFTPDLLPADLIGTEIYRPQEGAFVFRRGPLFHNLVLTDEINRAPAKVQSALLEAMAERQITVGGTTYPLPQLFLVMATQNPIEQEGTYPLPEAQLDRFLMYIHIDYPKAEDEQRILRLVRAEEREKTTPEVAETVISQEQVFAAQQAVLNVHMSEEVEQYLLQLIMATRNPGTYGDDLKRWLLYGASPRATQALDRCARAHAWLHGNDYVSPDDVQEVCADVLRHRLIIDYAAEAEGITPDKVIEELIALVAVP